MCNFLSAIVLRNGDVLTSDVTDSHQYLIEAHKLPDDRDCRHFAKVEFLPPVAPDMGRIRYEDVDNYEAHVDEMTEPSWWEDVAGRVHDQMRARVRRMLVQDQRRTLLGGRYILAEGANVFRAVGCELYMIGGELEIAQRCHFAAAQGGRVRNAEDCVLDFVMGGQFEYLHQCTLHRVYGGTFNLVQGSYVRDAHNGTFSFLSDCHIHRLYEAKLGRVGNSSVHAMFDDGTLGGLSGCHVVPKPEKGRWVHLVVDSHDFNPVPATT